MPQPLLDEHTDLLRHLLDTAEQQDVYLIARLQRVESRGVTVNNGRTEGVATSLSQGIGLHLFDRAGHTAFAATDQLTRANCETALRSAIAGLHAAAAANLQRNRAIFDVAPVQAVDEPVMPYPIDALPLSEIQERVEAINREVMSWGGATPLNVRTPFQIDREEW